MLKTPEQPPFARTGLKNECSGKDQPFGHELFCDLVGEGPGCLVIVPLVSLFAVLPS